VHVHGQLVPGGVCLCLRSCDRWLLLGTILSPHNPLNEKQDASGNQTANNDPGVTGDLIWIKGWQCRQGTAYQQGS
jgi:hypothetical protein